MISFRTFVNRYLAFLPVLIFLLGMAMGFDLVTLGRYRMTPGLAVSVRVTVARLGRWRAVLAGVYEKYRWFLPVLVVIFFLSIPVGMLMLTFDFIYVILLMFSDRAFVAFSDGAAETGIFEMAYTVKSRTRQVKVFVTTFGWDWEVSKVYRGLGRKQYLIDVSKLVVNADGSRQFVGFDGTKYNHPMAAPIGYRLPVGYQTPSEAVVAAADEEDSGDERVTGPEVNPPAPSAGVREATPDQH